MSLLAVDVAAEVVRLGWDRLHGRWALPAELVRLALARGAERVEVEVGRRRLALTAAGARVAADEVAALAALLGDGGDDGRRQAAVETLEAAGAEILLAFVGAEQLTLRAVDGGTATVLAARGRVGRVSREVAGSGAGLVVGAALGVARARAVAWLAETCAFAPVPVTVNRRRVDRGLDGAMIRQRVASPLPATLALTARDDQPILHLLRHGVVATHATVRGYPGFQAAVEVAGLVSGEAAPAALRAAVGPHLAALVDRVAAMCLEVAATAPTLAEPVRHRLALWLLEAAAHGVRREEILALPFLAGVAAGAPDWLAPGAVIATSARAPLAVVASVAAGRELRLERGLVASADELDRLAELGAGSFWRPAPPPSGWRLGHRLRAVLDWLRPPPPLVPPEALAARERRLLARLGERAGRDRHGRPLAWTMVDAVRPPLRSGRGGRLLVARSSPVVAQAAELVADGGDEWLYPAALALGAAPWVDLAALRRDWRTAATTLGGGPATPVRSTIEDPSGEDPARRSDEGEASG